MNNVWHDPSSFASYEYYAAHHFQFGKQIYQNVGPYGYVHYGWMYGGVPARSEDRVEKPIPARALAAGALGQPPLASSRPERLVVGQLLALPAVRAAL